jgi:hypothetical protein
MKHLDFIIYCIETYKSAKNMRGGEAFAFMRKNGVIGYIDRCYDALHTLGDSYIVWNIDDYISHHAKKARA